MIALLRFGPENRRGKQIAVQVKRYVSGGNDAGHIRKADTVRTLALSLPTRYLHSPSCDTFRRLFHGRGTDNGCF